MLHHSSTGDGTDDPPGLRIYLLGPPKVEWAGESTTIRRRQARALLYRLAAYLQPIPRERLCFLFWPDKPESKARRNFRRLLSSLRRELPASDVIVTPGDGVALDADDVWSDTTAFDALCTSAGPTRRIDGLRRAVDLYRGAFLASFSLSSPEYEAWVSQVRYAWERRYLETLTELIEIEMAQGDYEHAIVHARQYLAVDELAEDVHRRLIELYAAAGDRSAALEQYERCAVVLERELGVDPLPETQAIHQSVQKGKLVQRVVAQTEPTWTTLPGLNVPLVGREEALRQLAAAFAATQSGQGGVVLISGEAGIGKSRLMEEFASQREREALVLTGASYPDTGSMPYLPVLEALRSMVDLQEAAVQLEPAYLTEAARLIPELGGLVPDPPSDAERAPDEARRRLFEALSRLTLALSDNTQPMLLCLDDLHWADPTTLDWLAYLGRRLRDSRLLILGAYRTEEADALRDLRHNLTRSVGVTELPLAPLDTDSVSEILSYVDGRSPVAETLAARLRQTTGGNPFFLLELLRVLLESDEDLRDLAHRDLLPLSDSMRSAVEGHLSRLSLKARQVLEAGAVLGPRFSFELVRRTAGRGEMETVDALDQLVGRQVLTERPAGYRFRHETLRTVVYDDLTLGRRRLLHRRAGEALEALRIDDATALARHFKRAGPQQTEKAVSYLLQAGRRARRLSANEEAIELVTKGLELIETLPDTPERTQQELDLQVTLALALRDTKGYSASEVEQAYARAHELCRQIGESPQLFRVLWGLWAFYLVRGEYRRAREPAEQCLTLAQHMDDPALLVEAHRLLGSIFLWLGELAPARTHLEQVLYFYNAEEHRSHAFRYGQDPAIAARSYGAWTLWLLGYPDQALQWSHEAITLAQKLSHPYSLAYAYTMAPWMRGSRREAQVVHEQAEKAIALCDEQGFALLLAWGTILRGWALAEQGQEEEGIAQMREGLSECRTMASQIVQPYFLALLAEAYAKAGQSEEGLTVMAEAMAGVRQRGDRFYEAELHRLKGELLLALSAENRAEAEGCFRQSIEVARQQGAKSLELRAVMSFCRLLQQQGRSEEGRQMLSEVYNWFTEGFDTLDLVEAKELLEELAH